MKKNDKTREQLLKELEKSNAIIVELEKSEVDRNKEKQTLQKSEQELNAIFNGARDGIALLDKTGKILRINKYIVEVGGFTEEEIVGKRFNALKMFPLKSITKMMTVFGKLIKGEEISYEMEVNTKKGEKKIIEIHNSFLKKEGKVERVVATLRDITERKQAEEKEKEHHKNIELLSETTMQFVDFSYDKDIYKYIGEKLREFAGEESYIIINSIDTEKNILTTRSFIGAGKFLSKIIKLIGQDPVGMTYDSTDEALKYLTDGKLHSYEEGIYGISLKNIPATICKALEKLTSIEKIYTIGFIKDNKLFGTVAIFLPDDPKILKNRDIVEVFMKQASLAVQRRQAEEALKESNENFQQVVSNITTVVWKADIGENGAFENTYSSPIVDELLDLPAGTMKNDWDKYFSYIKPEYLERVNNAFREAIISPGKEIDCEYEVLKDNGQTAWFNSKGRCFEKNGKLYVFGSTIDITERKQAEELLRENELRYRSLTDDVLDTSSIGIFILDSDFQVVWINQALERYFGLLRKEVIGKDKRKLIRDRIKDIFKDPVYFTEKVFATYDDNTYVEHFECHIIPDKERKERWLEHWSQPILSGLYAGGRIEHYSDITERKKAERELQKKMNELEAFYRVTLGREGRVIELKQEVNELLEQLGKKKKYANN